MKLKTQTPLRQFVADLMYNNLLSTNPHQLWILMLWICCSAAANHNWLYNHGANDTHITVHAAVYSTVCKDDQQSQWEKVNFWHQKPLKQSSPNLIQVIPSWMPIHCVSKTHQLWNGIAQNYKDRFWWHLEEIFKHAWICL